MQNYLELQSNDKIIENLPNNTNLHFAKFEDDFDVCKNFNTNKSENIPIDEIPKDTKNGDTLVYKDGKFLVK